MIGDEAMFVAEFVMDAARIGIALAEAYADDELLSDVRVGLSVGPVLIQDGDYFGPVVNLASRMVNIADPGAVLVSEDFRDALLRELHPATADGADGAGGAVGDEREPAEEAEHWRTGDEEFVLAALRPRVLKDFGRVQLWSLHRPGDEQGAMDRRMGRRWERLAEVMRDLEDLRQRGERLLGVGRRAGEEGADEQEHDGAGDGSGQVDGGDAEGAERKAPVDGLEGAAPQVDEPA
jgi:hypothetical protein